MAGSCAVIQSEARFEIFCYLTKTSAITICNVGPRPCDGNFNSLSVAWGRHMLW